MQTAKGLKGIRKFLAVDAERNGWHVWLDDDYVAYYTDQNVAGIHATLTRTTRLNITLTGWTGNGLTFTSN